MVFPHHHPGRIQKLGALRLIECNKCLEIVRVRVLCLIRSQLIIYNAGELAWVTQ